ncbi:MAG: ATP-binding protein [Isosphaeraceae bacterium]
MMFRSLRWRLQVWHALILLIVVVGFAGMLYAEVRKARLDEIDAELLSAARVLEGVLRTLPELRPIGPPNMNAPRPPLAEGGFRPFPGREALGKRPPRPVARDDDDPNAPPGPPPERGPGPGFPGGPAPGPPLPRLHPGPPGMRLMPARPPRVQPQAFSLPNSFVSRYEEMGEAPYFVVRAPDGEVIRAEPPETADEAPADPLVGRRFESHARNRGFLREVTLLGPAQTTILVGRPIHHEIGGLHRMALQLTLSGLAVFVAGLLGGWWLSARAVRPIVAMSNTVSTINATNLAQRLDLEGVDTELSSLGSLINTMLERLEGSFAQQVRFTADASHELRTPLAVILSQVELALARPREAAAYREALEACGRAGHRMKSLVDDLLTLARADSGKLELRLEPVDLGRVAEDCVALLRPLAQKRGVRLTTDVSPTPLKADPARLAQVLTNLLSNAIQYNHNGGEADVSVRLDAGEALVVVRDTGVGIPADDLPRVFDRFHRVDSARSRESGGSGLGLAICRSIVEAHGGTIAVSSLLDRGTTFTVRLPRSPLAEPAEL